MSDYLELDALDTSLLTEEELEVLELQQRIDKMDAAVVKHHSQKADDRCVADDIELYAAFGLPPADIHVGDKFEMLKNCTRFIDRRCEGGGWPAYVELEERIRTLELWANEAYYMLSRAQWGPMSGVRPELNLCPSCYYACSDGHREGCSLSLTLEKYACLQSSFLTSTACSTTTPGLSTPSPAPSTPIVLDT